MQQVLFEGLATALVTPFVDGSVNGPMVDLLIRRQILAGVPAVVLAGTTGESPTLSDEEKLELFRRGLRAADGGCKLIAGTGSNDTRHAVELSREAEKLGVDALLVVTPYYNKTTQQGLVDHYRAIAEAVSIPVIAYNVPSRTGMDLGAEACRELARIPNLAGLKEAGGNLSKIAHILAENGDLLPVYSGNDEQTVPVMALGGKGVISVASNVLPGEMNALVRSALRGDYDMAALIQKKLLPLMDLLQSRVNPIPVKAVLTRLGFDVGPGRMPLAPPDEALLERIDAFFRHWQEEP